MSKSIVDNGADGIQLVDYPNFKVFDFLSS